MKVGLEAGAGVTINAGWYMSRDVNDITSASLNGFSSSLTGGGSLFGVKLDVNGKVSYSDAGKITWVETGVGIGLTPTGFDAHGSYGFGISQVMGGIKF